MLVRRVSWTSGFQSNRRQCVFHVFPSTVHKKLIVSEKAPTGDLLLAIEIANSTNAVGVEWKCWGCVSKTWFLSQPWINIWNRKETLQMMRTGVKITSHNDTVINLWGTHFLRYCRWLPMIAIYQVVIWVIQIYWWQWSYFFILYRLHHIMHLYVIQCFLYCNIIILSKFNT